MKRTLLGLLVVLAPFVAPAEAQAPLEIRGLAGDEPFAVTASATEGELVLEFEIQRDWHLYGRDVGGGQPVSVVLEPGGAFAARGALRVPMDAAGEVAGSARVVLPIERVGKGSAIAATLSLQVCDALQCLLPMQFALRGEVPPVAVLLVVAERGERTARIEAWLGERAFAVTTTTYAEVTAELCDASDVVLADSDYFQRHGVGRELIRSFPRTSAPIVAVGFLGTELVEAHGVAMTSGYI